MLIIVILLLLEEFILFFYFLLLLLEHYLLRVHFLHCIVSLSFVFEFFLLKLVHGVDLHLHIVLLRLLALHVHFLYCLSLLFLLLYFLLLQSLLNLDVNHLSLFLFHLDFSLFLLLQSLTILHKPSFCFLNFSEFFLLFLLVFEHVLEDFCVYLLPRLLAVLGDWRRLGQDWMGKGIDISFEARVGKATCRVKFAVSSWSGLLL